MIPIALTKPCTQCGVMFLKPSWVSRAEFVYRQFCSPECSRIGRRGTQYKPRSEAPAGHPAVKPLPDPISLDPRSRARILDLHAKHVPITGIMALTKATFREVKAALDGRA